MGNTRTSGLDWCGTNVLGGEQTAAAMPPHSARLTRTASFLWVWKALQPASRAQVTAVLLAVWNPGDRNRISSHHYAGGLRGESSRLFQYILSLKIRGRANRVEQGVGRPVKRCIVEVSGPIQLIQQQEEHGRDVILQTNASGLIHSLTYSLIHSFIHSSINSLFGHTLSECSHPSSIDSESLSLIKRSTHANT